jgi:hypothetical protein
MNADDQRSEFVDPRLASIGVYKRSGVRSFADRCRLGDHDG